MSGFLARLLNPPAAERRGREGIEAVLLGGERSASGVRVTTEGALRFGAVYACVRVLAETVASLPLIVYQRRPRGKDRAENFYLYSLLHDRPNPLMTSFEFREALQAHLALWGNGYCEIEYANNGRIVALWPLRPDRMEGVERKGNELVYSYRLPNGNLVTLPGWRVWHLRGLSSDGITGYSPIALQRLGIGLGMAAEEFGARFFGNDARPGGVLEHPGTLDDEAHDRLRNSWESRHGGLSRSHRVAILEEGMKYHEVGIPPQDAQFLETRKFQRSDVAGWYRIPPHLIGDMEHATFSNIEHQGINFVVHTMMPWLKRWEQGVNLRLLTERERRLYFAEFLVDALLRGDTVSRYQAYSTAFQNGWMSQNDIRERENLNPVKGGDVYYVPLNLIPSGREDEEQGSRGAAMGTSLGQRRLGERMVRLGNGREVRASQLEAARERQRLQVAFVGLYEDVAGRVVRREANDVANAARRLLKGESLTAFLDWLREFYREHEGWTARQFRPVMMTYAAQIVALAAAEVDRPAPSVENFVGAYLVELGARLAVRSENRIRDVLRIHDEPLEALLGELELWRELKGLRIARDESVRAGNAVALSAYGSMGVNRKVWVAFGENCPYCQDLSGKVVGLETYFVNAGTAFEPEGAERPLKTGSNVGHAPLHDDCDCQVVSA